MPRRRIAVDASRANASVKTGTEWHSHEVISAMARVEERSSLVLYDRAGSTFATLSQIDERRVIRLPRLWTHVGLSFAMLRDRPDALFVPSHVVPLVHPEASVVTIHDLGYRFEPGSHRRSARLMLEIATRWNARSAKRIIAISGQTRDDLCREYKVNPSSVTVVHSGLNHERFRPSSPEPVLGQLRLSQPYILFLSTVQPRKNLLRLVEAFEAIDRDDLSLVVAGRPGWLSVDIEERLSGGPKASRITRLGYVRDDLVPALYSGAEAFVLPSLYEGFGFGILEAMACGCPVVTSDRSSMPEVAGGAAILVDPTDVSSIRAGIERAMLPKERARLVDAGLRRAAAFTWDRTARETLAVIEQAMMR
ncbi:MAG TPA: glycosyltransferase family 1 protein [Thermomicrobiales bacterium]|nr:glycosyltransferase family 1 protein [Thermomicrobiales bacterium]